MAVCARRAGTIFGAQTPPPGAVPSFAWTKGAARDAGAR